MTPLHHLRSGLRSLTLVAAARTGIGPGLVFLSSHNGAHSGDPGAVAWTAAVATVTTAGAWALSRG